MIGLCLAASRWLISRYPQVGTLLKNVKFGADWTVYTQATTTSCFMANNASSWQQHLMTTHKLPYLALRL